MLDQHTLVVARHDRDVLDRAREDGLYRFACGCGYIAAVVERKFHVRVDGVVVLAELAHDRALNWPWQLALIAGELVGQLDVGLALGTALPGSRAFLAAALARCLFSHEIPNRLIERLGFLLLARQLLLEVGFVAAEFVDQGFFLLFVALKRL